MDNAVFYSQGNSLTLWTCMACTLRRLCKLWKRGWRWQEKVMLLSRVHLAHWVCVIHSTWGSLCNCNHDFSYPGTSLIVITGRGTHSVNGIAKLKPAVISFLKHHHYWYDLLCTLHKAWMLFLLCMHSVCWVFCFVLAFCHFLITFMHLFTWWVCNLPFFPIDISYYLHVYM